MPPAPLEQMKLLYWIQFPTASQFVFVGYISHYCDYIAVHVRDMVIFFFVYFSVTLYWYLFLFGTFVVFVHISQLLGWFMPSVFFCCCWNYVPVLSASSACCRFVHDHPFSLCIGWYSISKLAWYVISCVILGTLSIYLFVVFCFLLFNHCSGLVPSSIFLFDGLFLSA